ncbi:MAG: TDT family transporter [Clostridiales bacterium]|nr:TDT family transporter [Clostridiales bacterium]
MKQMIRRVPLPLSGVMLGTAALGNLLQSVSEALRGICGCLAVMMLVLLLAKLILFPKQFREDMKNPILAGISGTFPMALMLLTVYAKPFIGGAAFAVWAAAIVLHTVLIVYFTVTFLFHFDLKNVFTVYFIVYVGIVVASVTAPAYGAAAFGSGVFWFGFICFLILLVPVTLRYTRIPAPEPARSLVVIYAAPLSLCVAGYVQSVTPKSFGFLAAMTVCANLIYLAALLPALRFLTLPFYPSLAAFTFPLVITAIATKQTMMCAAKMGRPLPMLGPIAAIETAIASAFVLYVVIRYMAVIFFGGTK